MFLEYFNKLIQNTKLSDERCFKILSYRFNIEHEESTLTEVAQILSICKERVRQLQNHNLENIKNNLKKHEGYNEFEDFIQNKLVVMEQQLIDYFGCESKLFKILLACFGFQKIPHLYVKTIPAWINRKADKSILKTFNYFYKTINQKKYDIFDINDFENQELINIAINLNPNIIKTDNLFQFKTDLISNNNLVYKFLKWKNKICHYNEFINHLENNNRVTNRHNMLSLLNTDKRFSHIGRSGKWGLVEWNLCTKTVKQLTREFFEIHESGTINEIVNYVSQQYKVKKGTVKTYIQSDKQSGKYEIIANSNPIKYGSVPNRTVNV